MKRLVLTAAVALLSFDALAVGRVADVTVIDRDSGRTLPTYYHRGEYWVAGTPGARYGIEVHNRTTERLLAVMAVDGVNVVSGETAGWDQTGYVFAPYQSYDVTGWRKSNAEVAAFQFAAAPDSYAARTGRAANIGVIGIAIFRERIETPPLVLESPHHYRSEAAAAAEDSNRALGGVPGSGFVDKAARASPNAAVTRPAAPAPSLGTAHGQREGSYVEHTEFTRRQSSPDEIIRIRYDSQENLVAQGVIRRPAHPAVGPNPFPQSGEGFVPDPPGYSGPGLR
jgi:hypothetical protein